MDIVTVDESAGRLVTSADKQTVKDGPTFDDDREITPDYENQVYSYYGLQAAEGSGDRGAYGEYYGDEHPGVAIGDTESGEFREHDCAEEGVSESGGDLDDEDELRFRGVRRSFGPAPAREKLAR